uniref:outer membrane protein assembly factor n=1 Tax=Dyadobacter sp. MSC1_007 TaxID=2909264 RepID=UPI00202EFD3F|nr:outer membrane protein assembly factor [Dyadobacter sp. MSC1_007]
MIKATYIISLVIWLSLSGLSALASGSRIAESCLDTLSGADTARKVMQKDIIDIFRQWKNKDKSDSSVRVSKIRSGKPIFSVVPAGGYTLSSGLTGSINVNTAFYTSNPKTTNISSITTNFIYSEYKQMTIPVQANIWTRDNNYNFLVDWRFFKYPQDTYGLGSDSKLSDATPLEYRHIRLHQFALKRIGKSFFVGLGFAYDKRWRIKKVDGQDNLNKDVEEYGLGTKSSSTGPVATVSYDSRTNSINPLKGFYTNMQFRPNMKSLGSTNSWQSLVIDVRRYFNLPRGSQNTLAFWNYNWLTIGKPPYLDLPATGWDPTNNTGRGYIQGRFRSTNLLYFESEYRFALTKNGLFGGVLFANAQSVSDWPSKSFRKVAPAGGLGIRIKVNKTSGANIGIDYGFGMDGSRGLFVNLGEVF